MGLCNSSDIFQEKMNKLINGLKYVRAYIDDLLIISNDNFEGRLNKTKIVLNKLKAAGFKMNVEKLFFARDNLEYVGFKITRQGMMPLLDKVQAAKYVAVTSNKNQLRSFKGVINSY